MKEKENRRANIHKRIDIFNTMKEKTGCTGGRNKTQRQ